MVFSGSGGNTWRWSGLTGLTGRTAYDYTANVDAGNNSAVMACVGWIARAFPEAPVRILDEDGEPMDGHPLAVLLRRPNPYYSGPLLWMATLTDFNVSGNAYWLKERSAAGRVTGLWYTPSWLIRPQWDREGTAFLTHYEYNPNGQPQRVDLEDVVHFRYGLNPVTRTGMSPLSAVLREIWSDEEAANFTGSLLRNLGVPGVIISPEESGITNDEAEEVKAIFEAKFGGDQRGRAMVMKGPSKVEVLSFSPEQMDLKALRRIPEERVSAVLGVPAIVAGLGAGLDRCIIGNMRVATPDRGPVEIRHLEAGDTVWAIQNGQIQASVITWAGKTGHREVFTVKTPNRTITATENHPFLVRRMVKVDAPMEGPRRSKEWRYSLEWVELRNLAPGDQVVEATQFPDVGRTTLPDATPATPEMLEWFGAFVGDGSYLAGESDKGLTLSIPIGDRVGEYYRALTASLFAEHRYRSGGERPWKRATDGLSEVMVERNAAGESYHAIGRALGMNNATVRSRVLSATMPPRPVVYEPVLIREVRHGFAFTSVTASRWVRSLGFRRGARLKRIPPWVFGLSADLRLAFLCGLLDTDGSVDKIGLATFTFAGEELTRDTWHLALSCGLSVSNVRPVRIPAERLPQPGRQAVYDAWTFTVTNVDDVRRIGTHDPKYQERLDAATRQSRRGVVGGHPKSVAVLPAGCAFTKVQSITPTGTADVYDLTVESAHNFIAEGLVVHNSTFANMSEAREMAYESNIIPTQRLLAAELHSQLLRDFDDPDRRTVAFDLSQVRVLSDDEDRKYARIDRAIKGGWISLAEARRATGWEVLPEHDVYYLPTSVMVTPVNQISPIISPPALPPAKAGAKARVRTHVIKALALSDADEAEAIYEARLALFDGRKAAHGFINWNQSRMAATFRAAGEKVRDGISTLNEFRREMQAELKAGVVSAYRYMRGDKLTDGDLNKVNAMLGKQDEYLTGFVAALGDDEDRNGAPARAALYAGAATEAQAEGTLAAKADDEMLVWNASDDDRMCDDCAAMSGETRTVAEWAVSDRLPSVNVECQSNCRCSLDAA